MTTSKPTKAPEGQPVIPALRHHLEHTHMDKEFRAKLLEALEARKQVGIKEYGVELKTRCLENPALEAQHEIEGGLCYTFTEKMERGRWTPRTAGAFHHLLQAWMILQADESGEPQGTPGAPKPPPPPLEWSRGQGGSRTLTIRCAPGVDDHIEKIGEEMGITLPLPLWGAFLPDLDDGRHQLWLRCWCLTPEQWDQVERKLEALRDSLA